MSNSAESSVNSTAVAGDGAAGRDANSGNNSLTTNLHLHGGLADPPQQNPLSPVNKKRDPLEYIRISIQCVQVLLLTIILVVVVLGQKSSQDSLEDKMELLTTNIKLQLELYNVKTYAFDFPSETTFDSVWGEVSLFNDNLIPEKNILLDSLEKSMWAKSKQRHLDNFIFEKTTPSFTRGLDLLHDLNQSTAGGEEPPSILDDMEHELDIEMPLLLDGEKEYSPKV